jgi:hypothetical protein
MEGVGSLDSVATMDLMATTVIEQADLALPALTMDHGVLVEALGHGEGVRVIIDGMDRDAALEALLLAATKLAAR